MGIMLHVDAEYCTYDELKAIPLPPRKGPKHIPLAHHKLIDMARVCLQQHRHEIVEQRLGVTHDGLRMFGLLQLRSNFSDSYEDAVILRNANDYAFAASIGFGSHVFCCDNLAFYAEHIVQRKHTLNAQDMIFNDLTHVIEPLWAQRNQACVRYDNYKKTGIDDDTAYANIVRMYQRGVIVQSKIPAVVAAWDKPEHAEFEPRNVWSLFNAATSALEGRVAANTNSTQQLHSLCDVLAA